MCQQISECPFEKEMEHTVLTCYTFFNFSYYSCFGDYRDANTLIGQVLRHISL